MVYLLLPCHRQKLTFSILQCQLDILWKGDRLLSDRRADSRLNRVVGDGIGEMTSRSSDQVDDGESHFSWLTGKNSHVFEFRSKWTQAKAVFLGLFKELGGQESGWPEIDWT